MIIRPVIFGFFLHVAIITKNAAAQKESSTDTDYHSALPDPVNDSLLDTSVDTLINKVVELSERYKKDENGTIADVQQMIQTDKSLLRLTRGEIIDLLENITNTSPEIWKDKIIKSRKKYQKAIMLVMPYTPKNSDSLSIEELYTKPPITHIVGTERKTPQNNNKHIEILALDPSTTRPVVVKRPLKPMKQINLETKQDSRVPSNKEINKQPSFEVEPAPGKPQREENTFNIESSTLNPVRFFIHRNPEENAFVPSDTGISIIKAPNLISKPDIVMPNRNVRPIQSNLHKLITKTTTKPRVATINTSASPLDNLDIPEEVKDGVKDVHFEPVNMKPPKYSSQYDASVINFAKQDTSTENVQHLLDSITPQHITSVPDISGIADHLSSDMRDLLKTFGLIENPNKSLIPKSEAIISQPDSEELNISPLSYNQFKPLPDSVPTREDMQGFLAEFGLIGNSKRLAKKLETSNEPIQESTHLSDIPNINMEMIPESMHDVLEEIGFSEKGGKKTYAAEKSKETHVFNPEQTYVSENEIKRLNQLLETIKRLEKLNRTATPEDLKDLDLENIKELTKILKQDATLSLDKQNFGPDPFDFYVSPDKNEVKRQQSTTTESSTTLKTNEDESKNPSLAALEESFGGNAGAAAENVDANLPPPRRTGFYYLVDWNSFLEVGEEGRNKVNIRFSPQAGDPSRFLRVKVP